MLTLLNYMDYKTWKLGRCGACPLGQGGGFNNKRTSSNFP